MQVLAHISLNFQQPNYLTVYAAQNDRLSRYINAQLLDGSEPWTLPTGGLMTVRYRKPDGTSGFYDTLEDGSPAYNVETDGSITFGLAEQALTVPGAVPVELNFYNAAGSKLSTLTFIVAVKPSAYSDEDIASSDYYNILTAKMQELAELSDQAEGDYQDYLSALSAFVGAPRTAPTAADMLDTNLVYVYTGSETGWTYGDWYYYNGREWVSGGVYNSAAISLDDTLTNANKPAQAKAAGDLVLVQDTQPTDTVNKLWFPLTDPEEVQVPTYDEYLNLKSSFNALGEVPETIITEETAADLYLCDSQGNVLAEFADGHFKTKNFSSANVDTTRITDADKSFFDLADAQGNVVVRFSDGHFRTKGFDSATVKDTANSAYTQSKSSLSLFNIFSNCYLYQHMFQELSQPYIPAESIYDVRFAKAMGFDMIEANTQELSDGVFVVKHGQNDGTLGAGIKDAIGDADYSEVKWADITSTWLRENVVYNAQLPKFCGPIPTLDEFCEECRRFGMKVKVSSIGAAHVARKYLPDEMIWVTQWNPSEGREDFRGTIEVVWLNGKSVDSVIETAKAIGAPINIVISGVLSSREESDVAEMVQKAHNNGFTVGIVYPKPSDLMAATRLGIDCAGSTNRSVNIFSRGSAKHIVSLDDSSLILADGASYDSTTDVINMPQGASIYSSGNIVCGKGCLTLRYSGSLTLTIGRTGENYELQNYASDGDEYVVLSNLLMHESSAWDKWFNITATAATTIYEMTFDGEILP